MDKIEVLDEVLFKCVKKKLQQNNKDIEAEVQHILTIIDSDPTNIEEVTEVRNFINCLEDKMEGVNNAIQEVMDKLGLLEKH
jgi:hypothetical protein